MKHKNNCPEMMDNQYKSPNILRVTKNKFIQSQKESSRKLILITVKIVNYKEQSYEKRERKSKTYGQSIEITKETANSKKCSHENSEANVEQMRNIWKKSNTNDPISEGQGVSPS